MIFLTPAATIRPMWYVVDDVLGIRQLEYNFLPSWWHGTYGIGFGERFFVSDPDYRIETQRFMDRTVHERFPGLHLGSADPKPQPLGPGWGSATIPSIFGCEVVFSEDGYPWNRHLPGDELPRLSLPDDLSTVFPISEIERQMRYVNRKLGTDAAPLWPSGGVVNTALQLRGPDFFTDWHTDPESASAFLDTIHRLFDRVIRRNHEACGWHGLLFVACCSVSLAGPKFYVEALRGYDIALQALAMEIGAEFEIHHCGHFDAFPEAYRPIPRVDFLEVGWKSDVRRALDAFPESLVQLVINPVFVSSTPRAEIGDRVDQILEAARGDRHRFSLLVPDLEIGTPEENLYEIYERCRRAR